MASKSKRKPVEKSDALVEATEVQVQDVAVEEEAVESEVITTPRKEIKVVVYRDEEGRIVLEQEGKPKRIAGSDDAFAEVSRQFGEALVKERQI